MAMVNDVVAINVHDNNIVSLDIIWCFHYENRVGGSAGCICGIPIDCPMTEECSWLAWVAMAGCLGKVRHGGGVNFRVCTSSYVGFIALF